MRRRWRSKSCQSADCGRPRATQDDGIANAAPLLVGDLRSHRTATALMRELVRECCIVTIERRQISDQVVFFVSGRMDAENAPQFEQRCRASIDEGLAGLVVDLGELSYLSSLGLRSFVSLGKTLQDKGGALRICCLNGLVKQVFEITGPLRSFSVYDSVEAALIGG